VQLSNLSLQLYSWYVKNGHARNEKEEAGVKAFFREHLPKNAHEMTGFYERLYFYQSYCWYSFIRQDFFPYYRYSSKWVNLFEEQEQMIKVEVGHYIKGMHNLLSALYILRNHQRFQSVLEGFEAFAASPTANQHDNFRVQTFVYLYTAKINWHFMLGTYKEGLLLIPQIEKKLTEYDLLLDKHRVLVFNYKIAYLFFGSGRFEACIDYLHKIINEPADLRFDLQCYARLLHLLAHYELGNSDLLEYLIKSVYRFMAKMENLTVIEEEVFRFLRTLFKLPKQKLKPELENFLQKIKQFERSRYETRAFAYLDIISWVESKVYGKSMSEITKGKYEKRKLRNYL
jgi:hypothetical protein